MNSSRDYEKSITRKKAKSDFLKQSKQTISEMQGRGMAISPIAFHFAGDRIDEERERKSRGIKRFKELVLLLFAFLINVAWFIIEGGKTEPRQFFLHSSERSKREYINNLILHISTFLSISTFFSVFIGLYLLPFSLDLDLYSIESFLWYPDHIFSLSYIYPFSSPDFMTLLTAFILSVLVPYFIAGLISGILWKENAKDVIGPSATLSLLFFLFFYFSQELLNSVPVLGDRLAGFFISSLFASLQIGLIFIFYISSLIGGILGVLLGNILTNISLTKKGAISAYSSFILPEMPITTQTLFDMVDVNMKLSKKYSNKVSLVYLNRKVELTRKKEEYTVCPYFVENRCAYLGYRTTGHRYQICISEFHNTCRVLAFILQSGKILDKINEGVDNNE